jgi:hypothetical protein
MAKEDYTNPSYKRSDHPSFKEKKHSLVIDTQGASNREIHTESGTLRFEDGVAVLPDDTRAKDIYDEMLATQATHPDQYTLVEDKPTVNVDKIHRYTFGYNRRFSEAWDRIFGNPDNQEDKELDNGRKRRDRTAGGTSSGVVRTEG